MGHLQSHGYQVDETEAPSVAALAELRTRYGVPAGTESCHTALVGRYVIEGHVPAEVIDKLLAEQPDIVGLVVPGMPAGSPGMEMGKPQHYDVLAIGMDGSTSVYAQM